MVFSCDSGNQDISQVFDVSAYRSLVFQARLMKAGTAGNYLRIQHASTLETDSFTDLFTLSTAAGSGLAVKWDANTGLSANQTTIIPVIDSTLRYIRWITDASMGGAIFIVDVLCRE